MNAHQHGTVFWLSSILLVLLSLETKAEPLSRPYIPYRTSPFNHSKSQIQDNHNVLKLDDAFKLNNPTNNRRSGMGAKVNKYDAKSDNNDKCPFSFTLGISRRSHHISNSKSFSIVQSPVIYPIFPARGPGKQILHTTLYEHLDLLSPMTAETPIIPSTPKASSGSKGKGSKGKSFDNSLIKEGLVQHQEFPLLFESSSFAFTSPIIHDCNADGVPDTIIADYDGGIYIIGLYTAPADTDDNKESSSSSGKKRFFHRAQVPRLYVRKHWVEARVNETMQELNMTNTTEDNKDNIEEEKTSGVDDDVYSYSSMSHDPYHSYFEFGSSEESNKDVLRGISANVFGQKTDDLKALEARREQKKLETKRKLVQRSQRADSAEEEEDGDGEGDDRINLSHRRLQEVDNAGGQDQLFWDEERVIEDIEREQQQQQENLQHEGTPQAEEGQQQQNEPQPVEGQQQAEQQQQQEQQQQIETQNTEEQQQPGQTEPEQNQEQQPVETQNVEQQHQEQQPVETQNVEQQHQEQQDQSQNENQQREQQQQAEPNVAQQEQQQQQVEGQSGEQQQQQQQQQETQNAEQQNEGEPQSIHEQKQQGQEEPQREQTMDQQQQQETPPQNNEQQQQQEGVESQNAVQDEQSETKQEQQSELGQTERRNEEESTTQNILSEEEKVDNVAQTPSSLDEETDGEKITSTDINEGDAEFISTEPPSDADDWGGMGVDDNDDGDIGDDMYGRDRSGDDEYGRYAGYDDYYGGRHRTHHDDYYGDHNYVRINPHLLCTPTLAELPKLYGKNHEYEDMLFVPISYYLDEDEYEGLFEYQRFNTDHNDEIGSDHSEVQRGLYIASAIMVYIINDSTNNLRWGRQEHLELSTDYSSPVNISLVGKIPFLQDQTEMGAFAMTSPIIADVDGDSNLDLILGTSMGLVYMLDARHLHKRDKWPVQMPHGIETNIIVEDVVGDTNLEIFVMDIGSQIVCLRHDATVIWNRNLFSRLASVGIRSDSKTLLASSSMTLGDIDGDGVTDIVVMIRLKLPMSRGVKPSSPSTYVFAINAATGEDLPNFPIEFESKSSLFDDSEFVEEEDLIHSKLPQPLLVDLHSNQNYLHSYLQRNGTSWRKHAQRSLENGASGGGAPGIHIVFPIGENLYIIEGGSGCTQRTSMGDDIISMVQVDDVHGTNSLDLVISTKSGNIITLELNNVPFHPLNVWSNGEKRGRYNAYTHGYSASQGIFVHSVSRQYRDVFGALVPVTFEIFDNRPNIQNEPNKRVYEVEIRDGSSSKRIIWRQYYNTTGIFTERLYIPYGPGYYTLHILMRTTHGLVYEDVFHLGYNINFLNGFGLMLWLPLMIASIAIFLCGAKGPNWQDDGNNDDNNGGMFSRTTTSSREEGILGRSDLPP